MAPRLLSLTVLMASVALAQTAFEVASIKPSQPGDPGMYMTGDAGRLRLRNFTLRHAIKTAYGIQDFQISGGPKWLDSDHYDIEATAPQATTHAQLLIMLQPLLADRFQLQFHRESRDVPGYAVVIGKNGPKLPKPDPDARPGWGSGSTMASGRNQTMERLVEVLSRSLGRPIVDETGYKDHFDFSLKWSANDATPAADAETGPSVFAAIQEQLGLRLEARRLPIEVFVIDRAERPAAN